MYHEFTKEDKYKKIIIFDENGSSSYLKTIQKAVASDSEIDDNRRYFTLTACVFELDEYLASVKTLENLTKRFWGDSAIPVVFHTRDIRKKQGYFNFPSEKRYDEFISSLSKTIDRIKCEIISITFDLFSYVKQYYRYDPYEVAFDIILGTAMFNIKEDEEVALVFETRGKNEDKILSDHIFKAINQYGTLKILPSELKKHFKDVFFNPKLSSDKTRVFHGIDIADLCSYPIYRFMRFGTKGKDFEIVVKKLAGYKKFKEKDMRIPGLRKFPSKWQK